MSEIATAQQRTRPSASKILFVHNYYREPGGEDSVVRSEIELLTRRGHEVQLFERHNSELEEVSLFKAVRETLWSARTVSEARQIIATFRPDVVHCHNTFPIISPSVYWAASEAGVPVVQTLHNFRLLCPQAMLTRQGVPCELCLGKHPFPAVKFACYRGSAAQSGLVAAMLVLHRSIGTWQNKVERYIALNEFCRKKFIQGGLPSERIIVKPNFVDMEQLAPAVNRADFLFVGRLTEEKGVRVLTEACMLSQANIRIAGTGPLYELLKGSSRAIFLGRLEPSCVQREMTRALALVVPSLWYENFPRAIVEAFACGLPVIASRIGALPELVQEGKTGLLFEPGNALDLAQKISWAAGNPDLMAEMGARARAQYEAEFTPEINYSHLMEIYSAAEQSLARAQSTP